MLYLCSTENNNVELFKNYDYEKDLYFPRNGNDNHDDDDQL